MEQFSIGTHHLGFRAVCVVGFLDYQARLQGFVLARGGNGGLFAALFIAAFLGRCLGWVFVGHNRGFVAGKNATLAGGFSTQKSPDFDERGFEKNVLTLWQRCSATLPQCGKQLR